MVVDIRMVVVVMWNHRFVLVVDNPGPFCCRLPTQPLALGKLSTTGGVGQLPVVDEEPSDEVRIEAVSSVVPTLDLHVQGKCVCMYVCMYV